MMNTLKTAFVLTLVALVSVQSRQVKLEETDEDLFREFIECARYAIITGIPEIGVPSHDPLIIQEEVNYEFAISEDISGSFSLTNMMMTDIPNWEVRKFDEIPTTREGVDVFNYDIYWPKMVFSGDWAYSLNIADNHIANKGTISLELDHIDFAGIFDFTKPGDGRTETINALILDVSTQEVELDITNLGPIGDLINAIGGPLLNSLIASVDDKELADGLRNKLINDWINKPERIDALIANCQK